MSMDSSRIKSYLVGVAFENVISFLILCLPKSEKEREEEDISVQSFL